MASEKKLALAKFHICLCDAKMTAEFLASWNAKGSQNAANMALTASHLIIIAITFSYNCYKMLRTMRCMIEATIQTSCWQQCGQNGVHVECMMASKVSG